MTPSPERVGKTSGQTLDFVEPECAVGGCACLAWNDWFQACEDADPAAIDEERDPRPLDRPFDPSGCKRPSICPLFKRAADPTPSITPESKNG